MADLDQVTPALPTATVNDLAALRAVPSAGLTNGETAMTLVPWPALFVWVAASLGPDQPGAGVLLPDDLTVLDPGRWVFSESSTSLPNGQVHLPSSATPVTEDDGAIFLSDGSGGLVAGSLYFRRPNNGPVVRLDSQGSAELDAGDTGAGAFAIDFTEQRLVRARLTGNCTLSFNFPAPGNYNLRLVQDGAGGHIPVLPASAWAPSAIVNVSVAADSETQLALVWTGAKTIITSAPNIQGSATVVGV